MAETRTPELVRHEIAIERTELVEAVESLRRGIADRTDVKSQLAARAAVLAPMAFLVTFVASGGIGATMRYVARRGRDR
jgi:hypothetical protein